VRVPEGDLPIFFFDPFYYQHVGGMLKKAEHFLGSLDQRYPERGHDTLINICTDGELYGHWEAYGERFLAYVLTKASAERGIRVTNYGAYLESHPPQDEVELTPQSSWSCPHGVERWRANCGCSDERPGQQHFRAPLRAALDRLGADLFALYEQHTRGYLKDPLAARNDLLSFRPGDAAAEINFLERHLKDQVKPVSLGVRQALLHLLESQRYAQMMFTSCAWFFWDVNRPEALQNLQYAARAIEYLQSTELIERVEGPFLELLDRVPSAELPGVTARTLFLREARYTALKYQEEMEEVAYDGGVLLKVPCELRGDASERLQWKLRSLAAREVREVTLDLGAVDYMDNYAVSALVALIPVLKNRGGRLRIYRARDNLREIFTSARLTGLLELLGPGIDWARNH
jgi:anti-anti-sigma factor